MGFVAVISSIQNIFVQVLKNWDRIVYCFVRVSVVTGHSQAAIVGISHVHLHCRLLSETVGRVNRQKIAEHAKRFELTDEE